MAKFPSLILHLTLIVTAAIFGQGCSEKPSVATGRQAFEEEVRKEIGTSTTTNDFKKTNGQNFQAEGMAGYRMFYEAVVSLPDGYNPECVSNNGEFRGLNCLLHPSTVLPPEPRGAKLKFTGEIMFQKSENGWLPASVSISPGALVEPGPKPNEATSSVAPTQPYAASPQRAAASCTPRGPEMGREVGWCIVLSADDQQLRASTFGSKASMDDAEKYATSISQKMGYSPILTRPKENQIELDFYQTNVTTTEMQSVIFALTQKNSTSIPMYLVSQFTLRER